jgi:hypothetical protein
MARSIWKGSIAFGLVNIPVSLTSADSRPDIQLHMVDSRNHARIRYERVNTDTGEEVPWDRMVKGYEHEEGQFILLTEEDLGAVRPKLTKTIEITEFVALEEIDPIRRNHFPRRSQNSSPRSSLRSSPVTVRSAREASSASVRTRRRPMCISTRCKLRAWTASN